jgi:restriction-modification enzyme MmeI-like protein
MIEDFISRWMGSGAAERANYQLFLSELCDCLNVERPNPARPDDESNDYVFERAVIFNNPDGTTSAGRIDLYKRGCFVLEAKQGSDRENSDAQARRRGAAAAKRRRKGAAVRGTAGWDDAMIAARGQAEQYARALPAHEGWPPFLVVVDVGYSIELYSDFSRSGKTYIPFPDARSHRILLGDLARERERLQLVWTEPLALDPARRSARVTREVAARLARLAKSLEDSGHAPESVAAFLMRAIFTMFAEDVKLLPANGFTRLLESLRDRAEIFPKMVRSLWNNMNEGGFSPILQEDLLRFNGGLFESADALPLTKAQLELLIEASRADWHDVEPAIFGTLLERALDPVERHKLGAHYTPRAYVERLVMPTIIEPLREEWEATQAAAVTLAKAGKLDSAAAEVRAFHHRLCQTRALDPACGTGNFLYVTLEHLKRLEGEVLAALESFREGQMMIETGGFTVDPHQLLGIEVNPRAAAIADLVLWIGYLQWHFRTRGDAMPPEPVLKKFRNIECRDAALAYDRIEQATDERGEAMTRWDGRTYKKHPVTGEDVPDETARVAVLRYVNPRKAEWPEADYVIGNPPFIGNWRMRGALGEGYVEALRKTYGEVPESSDYVMYWWEQAASLARDKKIKRFGFIATNSLRQTFNRRVVESHLTAKNPLSLVFAIPDHPWVDSADGAAVRISMTVGEAGEREGILQKVVEERQADGEGINVELTERDGKIYSDLTIGADVAGVESLMANASLSSRGVSLHGGGFIVSPEEARQLGLGRIPGLENHIRFYRNGRDLTSSPRNVMVIDLFGLNADDVRDRYPAVYQWTLERVKPDRDAKAGRTSDSDQYAKQWWLFGKTRSELRKALSGLDRYIATVETSKHRFFAFLDKSILPDNMLVNIALDDAFYLGALSSRIHVTWALAAGGRLGVGNDPRYNKTRCFEPFPFPDCDEQQKSKIRELGEALDAHRKRQQSEHPQLTITDMYNVMEKLRAAAPLNPKEKITHEQGLVSVLLQIHNDLDRAVSLAYGWPSSLTDEEILARLVALNRERAAEERAGRIRWLRPEFQNPQGASQASLATGDATQSARLPIKQEKIAWPRTLSEQARAVRQSLADAGIVITASELCECFKGGKNRLERISELLETLVSLGQARKVGPGRFAA